MRLTTDNPLFIIPIAFGIISISAGFIMLKFPPRKINWFYGYRTSSSMKNQKTWDFAQNYSSKELIKIGVVNMLISLIGLIYDPMGKMAMIMGLTVMVLSVIVLLFRVENALKNKFG